MAARDFDLAVDDMDDLPDAERLEVLEDVFADPLPDEPPDESPDESSGESDDEADDEVDEADLGSENPDASDAHLDIECPDAPNDASREDDVVEHGTDAPEGIDPDRCVRRALRVLAETVAQVDEGEVRAGQTRMCELVTQALAGNSSPGHQRLAVRAGTGVGKTFAYGVPAALSDERVVIATATKALQDQLKKSDMPMIAQAVRTTTGEELTVEILKGRSNYICRNRVERLRGLPAARRPELRRLIDFADSGGTGDKAELDFQPDEKTWRHVSVGSTECLGKDECEFGETCFTELARDRAKQADVVIVNHALYAWGLAKGGNTIPFHRGLVIDEAHEFVGYVRSVASLTISQSVLEDIARQARGKCDQETIDQLRAAAAKLSEALADRRDDLLRVRRQELAAGESPVVVALRVAQLRLQELQRSVNQDLQDTLDLQWDDDTSEYRMLRNVIADLLGDFKVVEQHSTPNSGQSLVFFVQKAEGRASSEFHGVPLSVGAFVRDHLHEDISVVLTSATLDRDLPAELGLDDRCRYETVESPFNYSKNALLYVPPRMPAPNQDEYREAMLKEVDELVGAIGGRTLALFTSWRALNECYDHLVDLANTKPGLGIRVYRQGDELATSDLIEKLRTDSTTVVCATMTFWQGVDVPGDGLQLLILDKLPFPVPTDPMHRALAEHLEEYGGDAFKEMSLPHAAVLLAQGLGRLIRTTTDRGVAAVFDSRLAVKEYRHRLLELVPPMERTTKLSDAVQRLQELRHDQQR